MCGAEERTKFAPPSTSVGGHFLLLPRPSVVSSEQSPAPSSSSVGANEATSYSFVGVLVQFVHEQRTKFAPPSSVDGHFLLLPPPLAVNKATSCSSLLLCRSSGKKQVGEDSGCGGESEPWMHWRRQELNVGVTNPRCRRRRCGGMEFLLATTGETAKESHDT
ncbi:hypothetical protein KSP39_PZI005056 [Platanthera zijinensis]|uniref:Uncharacterized protein n=1 Tax=Platanthera zijinensis TaxID=2320716 RepID=A0AAP0GBU3_9ASPA